MKIAGGKPWPSAINDSPLCMRNAYHLPDLCSWVELRIINNKNYFYFFCCWKQICAVLKSTHLHPSPPPPPPPLFSKKDLKTCLSLPLSNMSSINYTVVLLKFIYHNIRQFNVTELNGIFVISIIVLFCFIHIKRHYIHSSFQDLAKCIIRPGTLICLQGCAPAEFGGPWCPT